MLPDSGLQNINLLWWSFKKKKWLYGQGHISLRNTAWFTWTPHLPAKSLQNRFNIVQYCLTLLIPVGYTFKGPFPAWFVSFQPLKWQPYAILVAIILFLSRKGPILGDLLSLRHMSAFLGPSPPLSFPSKKERGYQGVLPSGLRSRGRPNSRVCHRQWLLRQGARGRGGYSRKRTLVP